jgi:hypothetical protein
VAPFALDPGDRNVANAIARRVTATPRKGSSDAEVGDACVWTTAQAALSDSLVAEGGVRAGDRERLN